MATATDVLTVAKKYIGYNGTGTSSVPYSIFGDWYGINPGQWCAMFVSFVTYTAGIPLPAEESKGFAYCPAGVDWFKAQGTWHEKDDDLLPGDIIFWDYGKGRPSHVGICEVGGNKDAVITSIQGNTTDATISRTGNTCRRKQHYRNYMVGFGRPKYGAEVVGSSGDQAANPPQATPVKPTNPSVPVPKPESPTLEGIVATDADKAAVTAIVDAVVTPKLAAMEKRLMAESAANRNARFNREDLILSRQKAIAVGVNNINSKGDVIRWRLATVLNFLEHRFNEQGWLPKGYVNWAKQEAKYFPPKKK